MYNEVILPMGAEHTTHDKLINIVNRIEDQAKLGLYTSPIIDHNETTRINDIYADNRVKGFLIYPMWKSVEFVDEEKIDGFSYTNGNGEFCSRKLSEAKETKGQPIYKTGHLPHLSYVFKLLAQIIDFDIHGELYKVGGNSDDVTKIMGCAEDKAIDRQRYPDDKLHYMVHDIRRFNGKDLTNEPWYVRRAILEYFFRAYFTDESMQYIHMSRILGNPINAFTRIVMGGGEGLMIKRTSGLYIPGKKPANNWIKCKREVTTDVVITGFNDGTGKNANLFGSIQFGMYIDGTLTDMGNVSSGLTDQMRTEMALNQTEYIGRVIEIDAMEGSGKSFRHPRFKRVRIDKNASECTWDNVKTKLDII